MSADPFIAAALALAGPMQGLEVHTAYTQGIAVHRAVCGQRGAERVIVVQSASPHLLVEPTIFINPSAKTNRRYCPEK